MLEPVRYILSDKKVILASGSPRRKEILERNLITPSNFSEDLDKSLFNAPSDYVLENSRIKTLTVAQHLKEKDWYVIIGADTVVVLDNKIYEKPLDNDDAFNMLSKFNGKMHKVYTGVSIVRRNEQNPDDFLVKSFFEETIVEFASVEDKVLKAYVDTGEPMDKAGGYGIQGLGASLIKSINGDYFNVMGFPVYKFASNFLSFIDHSQ